MSAIFAQQRGGGGNLFLGGSKISDQDIRDQNGNYLLRHGISQISSCNAIHFKCSQIFTRTRWPRQDARR